MFLHIQCIWQGTVTNNRYKTIAKCMPIFCIPLNVWSLLVYSFTNCWKTPSFETSFTGNLSSNCCCLSSTSTSQLVVGNVLDVIEFKLCSITDYWSKSCITSGSVPVDVAVASFSFNWFTVHAKPWQIFQYREVPLFECSVFIFGFSATIIWRQKLWWQLPFGNKLKLSPRRHWFYEPL